MKERIKQAVLASFAADSLALGVHWIYNTNIIDKKIGRAEDLLKPELAKFHKGKEKGAFTHYGDQALVLLESLAESKCYDANLFFARWLEFMKGGRCYMDGASSETIANFEQGASPERSGSTSSDLGGAARIAPLLLWSFDSWENIALAAKSQTALTHNNKNVVAAAQLFSAASVHVLNGMAPVEALMSASADTAAPGDLKEAMAMGIESRGQDTRGAIAGFGQMCAIEGAFPSTIHLIAKYEENLKEAMIENVMAGGDSSARGMLAGLVLGAYNGIGVIPGAWVHGMIAYEKIKKLMDCL